MQKKQTAVGVSTLIILLLCFFLATAQAEESGALKADEWQWDPGCVNSFSGTIDLSPWAGSEVTLHVTAEANPAPDGEGAPKPVFVILDGKRIVMLSQKDTEQLTAGAEPLEFNCSLRMPDDGRLSSVTLRVQALDGEGNELARTERTLYASILGGRNQGDVFRIPFEIRTVALWIAAAAAVVWLAAILLSRRSHKTH